MPYPPPLPARASICASVIEHSSTEMMVEGGRRHKSLRKEEEEEEEEGDNKRMALGTSLSIQSTGPYIPALSFLFD